MIHNLENANHLINDLETKLGAMVAENAKLTATVTELTGVNAGLMD